VELHGVHREIGPRTCGDVSVFDCRQSGSRRVDLKIHPTCEQTDVSQQFESLHLHLVEHVRDGHCGTNRKYEYKEQT
jgi:hypothetical protein